MHAVQSMAQKPNDASSRRESETTTNPSAASPRRRDSCNYLPHDESKRSPIDQTPTMGEDQQRRCRPGEEAEDRISSLPDELLHDILARLRCARAAARTGILSRRWRRVWTHLSELVLDDDGAGPDAPPQLRASFMDAVDGALGACLAPALDYLTIALSFSRHLPPVPAGRAAPWLRFAAQRVVGTLSLFVPSPLDGNGEEEEAADIELPACKAAQSITLYLAEPWRLRLPPAGTFTALTSLEIHNVRMEGGELTALVCTRCPSLRILSLACVTLVAASDFTMRSDSLYSVFLFVNNIRRLEIVAPKLHDLCLYDAIEARISAPKLAELAWHGDVYDPRRHQFVVGRRLRQLQILSKRSVVASLMRQFYEVDEMQLEIHIPRGAEGYESFLNETNKLPKCKTLSISLSNDGHGLAPAMVHLLRSCNSTRSLSIGMICSYNLSGSLCPSFCACRFEESCRIDDISLSSLEELKINSHTSSHGQFEFLEHLFRCNAPILRRLVVKNITFSHHPPVTKETCEKIRSMCRPNIEVEFYVVSAKGQVRLD